MMERVLHAATTDDTHAVGEALAQVLVSGDVVVLTGELGAGKTTLVRGVAEGLGAEEHVASPTFTLVREYVTGRIPIAHVDVYRLTRVQDVVDLGLEELSDGVAVLLIEWGDAIEELLPADRLRVELTTSPADDESRRIEVSTEGPGWTSREEALGQALDPWRSDP